MCKEPELSPKKTKFNICFVNKFNWLGNAPMGTVSVQMSHALANAGNNVTLFISGTNDPNPAKTLESKYGLLKPDNLNLEILSKGKFFKNTKLSFYFYLKVFLNILKMKNHKGNLVVISRNTHFLPFMFLLKKITGAMMFFETHSFHNRAKKDRKWFGIVPNIHALQPWLFEKIILPHIDGILCITRRQTRLYKLIAPNLPSVFLPLGSPEPQILNQNIIQSRDARKLLYCGRLTPYLDVKTLINALSLCKDYGVTMTWFGLSDKDKNTLLSLAKKVDVSDYIIVENWISHQELLQKMKTEFGIGLATYDNNFISSALTCPTKIFDYFASGLPVIGSSIGTVRDILTNGYEGLLYIPGDKKSLHKCIVRMIDNKKLYFEMQNNCLNSARRLSWANRAKNFTSFAERCCKE